MQFSISTRFNPGDKIRYMDRINLEVANIKCNIQAGEDWESSQIEYVCVVLEATSADDLPVRAGFTVNFNTNYIPNFELNCERI